MSKANENNEQTMSGKGQQILVFIRRADKEGAIQRARTFLIKIIFSAARL
jgi:hypothetical protein